MTDTATIPVSRYSHRQKGPLCWILYGSAVGCFGLAWAFGGDSGSWIAVIVGLVLAVIAPAFHHLTIEDRGDRLAVRFGPLPLFRTSVPYAAIKTVEVRRTLFLDGWGIHYSVRGGWVWNLWGRNCVVIRSRAGTLWIGTDDAAGLARFLESRRHAPASS